ncbi:MAG: hypothetical protein KatS3mg111_0705 [Pirellulaceae bacterium]|nr:MAG: hypothetical protein KatS3mg111_0705 [Pirellulaceae bacterium]
MSVDPNGARTGQTSAGELALEQLLARLNGQQSSPSPAVGRGLGGVGESPGDPGAPMEAGTKIDVRLQCGAVARGDNALPSFVRVTGNRDEPMVPLAPTSLEEAKLSATMVEEIIMRFLLTRGEATGREIADQLKLPFLLVEPLLERLKYEQLTAYRGATAANDYIHVLTDLGRERARNYNLRTTYFGSAPVHLDDYRMAVKLQTVEAQKPQRDDLLKAFRDLLIDDAMLDRLGPAVNSGRGMFLYGYPGNGKTSIAERVTAAFGKYIWIPRAVSIDGEIMRVYDPLVHEEAELDTKSGLLDACDHDRRWVRIKRPTVVAGGELTMEMLEPQQNSMSKIYEAPLQMKSNCGVLVIDDFGRQKMSVDQLLNRWIVPLEKRYDFLSMASGKKTQVPFDQLVVFSTNLQPKDLVDDAFLRRIPYKIEVKDPSEAAFRKLFEIMCQKFELPYKPEVVDYLIERHYKQAGRPLRNCHPRDLLLQVRNYCLYRGCPMDLTREYLDFAVENYFSIM